MGMAEYIEREYAVDAVPVSELKKLRDYLYAEDLIFMRGLAELNKLIANCEAKMDGVEEREKIKRRTDKNGSKTNF